MCMKLPPSELAKIQSKLVKLLALSASPNEAEAASALSKCQELMDKYNITSIDVDPVRKTVDTDSVTINNSSGLKNIPKWVGILAADLCDIFDCIGVTRYTPHSWNGVTFVGGASDVNIVADLYSRLRHIIGNMGRKYIMDFKGIVPLNPKSKETYCMGVVLTVSRRLRAIYKPPGNSLVVLKKEFAQKHCDRLFPGTKTAKFGVNISDSTDTYALQRGINDGNSVTINRAIK